jgi:hypothetical protein
MTYFAEIGELDVATGAIRTYTRASGTEASYGGVGDATVGPEFSPDGRWVAYASGGETLGMDGERRIYVQPFPATGTYYQSLHKSVREFDGRSMISSSQISTLSPMKRGAGVHHSRSQRWFGRPRIHRQNLG